MRRIGTFQKAPFETALWPTAIRGKVFIPNRGDLEKENFDDLNALTLGVGRNP